MDTRDEIPLEEHRYFSARLDHLETRNPVALLCYLERGTLTEHLRAVTVRAMRALGDLVMNQDLPPNQADELVMRQIVEDMNQPLNLLRDLASRQKLRAFMMAYRASLPLMRRTYLSQSETIE